MLRLLATGLAVSLSVVLACQPTVTPGALDIEVTALELHRAFRTDPDGARVEFGGKDLVIVGEVARAFPRFRGTTMSGDVTTPAQVMLKTELDTLPTDTKYVQVEGEFDAPDSLEQWAVDPRIRVGDTLRVSVARAPRSDGRIRAFTSPTAVSLRNDTRPRRPNPGALGRLPPRTRAHVRPGRVRRPPKC